MKMKTEFMAEPPSRPIRTTVRASRRQAHGGSCGRHTGRAAGSGTKSWSNRAPGRLQRLRRAGRSLPRAAWVWPGDEWRLARPLRLVGGPNRVGDDPVIRREVADRVGPGGIAGELERLAAAPAEVQFAAVAATARLRHPVRPAEALEEGRPLPDPRQRVL